MRTRERLSSPSSPQSSSTTLVAIPPNSGTWAPNAPCPWGQQTPTTVSTWRCQAEGAGGEDSYKMTHPLPMSSHSLPPPGAGSITGSAGAGPCHTLGTRDKGGFGRTCWGHGRCHCEQLSGCSTVSGTQAWPLVPGSCQSGAREMNVAAFILVPHGSTAFGLHPNQHGPAGQKLGLFGHCLPLLLCTTRLSQAGPWRGPSVTLCTPRRCHTCPVVLLWVLQSCRRGQVSPFYEPHGC